MPRLDLDKSYIYLIGLLVENKFKNNWELFIGKDRKYFKKILLKSNYDFYHFDSDKSYRGKKFLLKELTENKDSFIALFDDLSDNFFGKKKSLESIQIYYLIMMVTFMVWFLVVKISTLRFWGFSNEKKFYFLLAHSIMEVLKTKF